jgi:hypothetical protein
MRAVVAVVVPLLGLALCATPPAAAEQKGEEKVTGILVERIQDLHLTDAQEARIADIRKEYQPKVQAAARDLAALVKDEVEKARAVLTP